MTKINYKIYATPNGLAVAEFPLKGEYVQKVGSMTVEFVKGEGETNRRARVLDAFLKNQVKKAIKVSRTNLNEFKAALDINVFEELHNQGYIRFERECPPFVVYPTQKYYNARVN